ncbi:hypothetical protein C8Q76DRAFT_694747 [Earliella scabrosa]|nr:hypothetical protein C8Q76DRAFT_694747 [Earliella scabrosa]
MYAFSILVLSLLAGQAVGAKLPIRSTLLLPRQDADVLQDPLSVIPDQCKPDCQDAANALANCGATDVNCTCNDKAHVGLGTCMQCSIGLQPDDETVLAAAQALLERYEGTCQAQGVNFQPIELAKGKPSSAGSVAVASGSLAGAIGLAMAVLAL